MRLRRDCARVCRPSSGPGAGGGGDGGGLEADECFIRTFGENYKQRAPLRGTPCSPGSIRTSKGWFFSSGPSTPARDSDHSAPLSRLSAARAPPFGPRASLTSRHGPAPCLTRIPLTPRCTPLGLGPSSAPALGCRFPCPTRAQTMVPSHLMPPSLPVRPASCAQPGLDCPDGCHSGSLTRCPGPLLRHVPSIQAGSKPGSCLGRPGRSATHALTHHASSHAFCHVPSDWTGL